MAGRPQAIDLFSGAGGMSLGFEQAGFDIVLAVDADGHHVATHARNFPGCVTLCRSVADMKVEDVWAALGGEREIDLVFGGPPCQGFSHMGLRDAKDPRNTLVDEFARLIVEIRPKAFVMENVSGLLSGDTKTILDRIVAKLRRADYRITTPVRILDASDFGVPQKRRRLFLLGVRSDVASEVSYPDGPCPGQPDRPTVIEAIGDLPAVDSHPQLFQVDSIEYDCEPESDYAKVARGVSVDPSDFSYPRRWNNDLCTNCMRVNHTERAISVYIATPPGQTVPGHKLPRLDPNGICPTLRAGSDSNHGSHTAPRPIHPIHPRCITAREGARLHGFPDWFSFYPLKWHGARQVGNAVCPPVARAVGREIVRALSCVPRKPRKSVELDNEFSLPDERPRSLRRIPYRFNYPPVIAYLFDRAYDGERLHRPRFTFADVKEAIAETGVNLRWTRADTFIAEISRSRNVLQIVEPCMRHGYTIKAGEDDDFIGEFVRVGQPGTVEDKDSFLISSRDVGNAVRLGLLFPFDLANLASLSEALLQPEILDVLWPHKQIRIEVAERASRNGSGFITDYKRFNGRKQPDRGLLIVSPPKALPPRSRIARLAKEARVEEVIVLAALTAKHLLASRFDNCREAPKEMGRSIFEIG